MSRKHVLPLILLVLALLSLLILNSVAPSLVTKQLAFFLAGGVIFLAVSQFPFQTWQHFQVPLYLSLIGLLLLTRILGTVTRGAVSWIPVGPVHIEPSQLAIPFVGIWMANFLASQEIRNWRRVFEFLGIVGLPGGLIFIQPDLGSAVVYFGSLALLFCLSRTKVRYILTLSLGGLVVVAIAWLFLLKPYQKERITSFLAVEKDHTDASYNAIQSEIAVGSGALAGRGIGQGIQSHLRFLPERQTDFIFASLAEETGFIGSSAVIFLYSCLVAFIIYLASQAKNKSEQYFCVVSLGMLSIQTTINIGMNMGLLPITGITLPFLSYGGSSILSLSLQFGLLQAIASRQRKTEVLYLR
jgi:rod shape determining protein RodA